MTLTQQEIRFIKKIRMLTDDECRKLTRIMEAIENETESEQEKILRYMDQSLSLDEILSNIERRAARHDK